MTTTHKMILDWAADRGILANSDPLSQILKTVEEMGELAKAVNKGDREGQIDGIGDVYVTLVLVNHMIGHGTVPGMIMAPSDSLTPKAWAAVTAASVGQMSFWISAGMYAQIQEDKLVTEALGCLRGLAASLGLSLAACLDHAYGIISKRTGKMVDGVFLKDEDPVTA
jgi:hypothetical protein